jgi:hypothetical protein
MGMHQQTILLGKWRDVPAISGSLILRQTLTKGRSRWKILSGHVTKQTIWNMEQMVMSNMKMTFHGGILDRNVCWGSFSVYWHTNITMANHRYPGNNGHYPQDIATKTVYIKNMIPLIALFWAHGDTFGCVWKYGTLTPNGLWSCSY